MHHRQSGFTLPETLIATALLVSGLASVAWVFTASIGANTQNRHRAVAVILANEKLEEFEALPWSDPRWSAGGALDPASPAIGYSDVVIQGRDTYRRLWEITSPPHRSITIAVRGPQPKAEELLRTTIAVSPGF